MAEGARGLRFPTVKLHTQRYAYDRHREGKKSARRTLREAKSASDPDYRMWLARLTARWRSAAFNG